MIRLLPLALACAVSVSGNGLVTVSGVPSRYCPKAPEPTVVIRSVADEPVWCGLVIERRIQTGEWGPFWENVVGNVQVSKVVTQMRLNPQESRKLTLPLHHAAAPYPLDPGRYRLVIKVRHRDSDVDLTGPEFEVADDACDETDAVGR